MVDCVMGKNRRRSDDDDDENDEGKEETKIKNKKHSRLFISLFQELVALLTE